MTRETWYVLESGEAADPRHVAPRADGKLAHKDGRLVAYGSHGNPRSRSVDPAEEAAKAAPKPEQKPAPQAKPKDMKPDEQKPGYRTRESKAD